MKNNLKQIVGEAIGEASMCWSETPRGIFDSTRASKIADRVLNATIDPEWDALVEEMVEVFEKLYAGYGGMFGGNGVDPKDEAWEMGCDLVENIITKLEAFEAFKEKI